MLKANANVRRSGGEAEPSSLDRWIPAFAGMTLRVEMTLRVGMMLGVGMTLKGGMTTKIVVRTIGQFAVRLKELFERKLVPWS